MLGPWRTNAYIVSDGVSPEALLIDPVEDPDRLIEEAEKRGLRIITVVATHSHVDHVGGVAGVKERLRVPFIIGEHARESLLRESQRALQEHGIRIPEPPEPDHLLKEGDIMHVGSLQFEVLYAPGHWQGDIFLLERTQNVLFCGDAVFRGEIGRFNKGCDIPTLIHSLKTKFLTLPDETIVYPGHGPTTTVGYERENNPSLKK
jgi:glyoxylase-like metal-dependent hydrolase (beta-lactamase superfamily II)